MTLPPRWKIIRELKRIKTRFTAMPYRVFVKTASRYYYDLFLAKTCKRSSGDLPAGAKVAIYLIFPSDGVKPSHLAALGNIAEAGFAPLVISNLPLTDADRTALSPLCWQLIERPNFGYDFGGYRDGVLSLKDRFADLTHLALLNDSSWFPLAPSQNWLKDAEALDVDLAAAVYLDAADRVKAAEYRSAGWGFDPTHSRFHYGSFALLFQANIFRSDPFLRFWKRYPMTNDKDLTVRLGEVGLSKMVVSHGFTHGCTCDLPALPAVLHNLSDDRLAQLVRNLIMPFDLRLRAVQREIESLPPGTTTWRTEAEAVLLAGAVRTGAAYALCDLMVNELHLPFLKKSPLWLERRSSAALSDIVSRLPGDIGKLVQTETQEILDRRKPQFRTLDSELAQMARVAGSPE